MRKILLFPLTLVYCMILRCRNMMYEKGFLKRYQSTLPVISIGNVSLGGNGKTPCAAFVAEYLSKQGQRPCILSRGYGGKKHGPCAVEADSRAEDVGDEPLLLYRALNPQPGVPVCISRKRARGARFIEERKLGSCIILDDGLQHRALARDMDIVLIAVHDKQSVGDSVGAFFQDIPIPAGNLREPLNQAFARAHAVILFSQSPQAISEETFQECRQHLPQGMALLSASYADMKLCSATRHHELAKDRPVFAFSSIARPRAFHESLRLLGYDIFASHAFADHHPLGNQELEQLCVKAQGHTLVCTEKDLVKIPTNYHEKCFVLRGKFRLDRGGEIFEQLISSLVLEA